MLLTKDINLHKYAVTYYDSREPKPRQPRQDTVILDCARICALHRLGRKESGYITELYKAAGYNVAAVKKTAYYTATVALPDLWPADEPGTPAGNGTAPGLAAFGVQEWEV